MIIISADLTTGLGELAAAPSMRQDVARPQITVQTNPRNGSVGASIVQRVASEALRQANLTIGKPLVRLEPWTTGVPTGGSDELNEKFRQRRSRCPRVELRDARFLTSRVLPSTIPSRHDRRVDGPVRRSGVPEIRC
ncbi:hypothetical protein ABZ511_26470 [Nocardia gamkensis]|uniref:hypothetical protein n=1 Tax=Nocardia gamkensis TaxID=352869 RepID=UPI0033F8A742